MVEGVAQLRKKLTVDIPARVQQAARSAMEQGADETVAMMKRLVPVSADGSHGNAPGTLRDSIGWTWGDAPAGSFVIGAVQGREYKTMRITIYAGSKEAFYARFIEFGTQGHSLARNASVKRGLRQTEGVMHKGTSAQPFFFVSWRSMKKRVRSRMTRNVRKAIKAEGGV